MIASQRSRAAVISIGVWIAGGGFGAVVEAQQPDDGAPAPPAQTAQQPASQEDPAVSKTEQPPHTNRLIHATSPYLLQHAHNPVDWYEWGDDAFEKAKREDRPVFLSIGYAACHWCHVMEHECFEDEGVAALLNDGFVSIKVDREERPDIDEIYMAYTQSMTGSGGWPMSVWLMPDGTPFLAGTYFPRERFVELLSQIRHVWTNERDRLLDRSEAAKSFFARWAASP